MKKLMVGVVALLFCGSVKALDITDQIKLTLIDHVSVANQVKEGDSRVVMVDSIVLIGKHEGRSIFDLQGGIAGDARPEAGQSGINWIAGGFLKVSTFTKDKLKLADHWAFLNSLEYGLKYDYDFTQKKDYLALQFALSFGLAPIE